MPRLGKVSRGAELQGGMHGRKEGRRAGERERAALAAESHTAGPNSPALQFVVGLGDKLAATDVEEGMRVGVDPQRLRIQARKPGWHNREL